MKLIIIQIVTFLFVPNPPPLGMLKSKLFAVKLLVEHPIVSPAGGLFKPKTAIPSKKKTLII